MVTHSMTDQLELVGISPTAVLGFSAIHISSSSHIKDVHNHTVYQTFILFLTELEQHMMVNLVKTIYTLLVVMVMCVVADDTSSSMFSDIYLI